MDVAKLRAEVDVRGRREEVLLRTREAVRIDDISNNCRNTMGIKNEGEVAKQFRLKRRRVRAWFGNDAGVEMETRNRAVYSRFVVPRAHFSDIQPMDERRIPKVSLAERQHHSMTVQDFLLE